MKVKQVEREISHKIFLGQFETMQPTLRMVGELDEGESVEDALAIMDQILVKEWSKVAIHELRMVTKRRGGKEIKNDQVPELMERFKAQMK